MKRYGLTMEDYENLWKSQQGKCANPACGASFPLHDPTPKRRNDRILHVDHNHTTGEVRGLLCLRCNTALGQVDDDPARLQGLIDYLKG